MRTRKEQEKYERKFGEVDELMLTNGVTAKHQAIPAKEADREQ